MLPLQAERHVPIGVIKAGRADTQADLRACRGDGPQIRQKHVAGRALPGRRSCLANDRVVVQAVVAHHDWRRGGAMPEMKPECRSSAEGSAGADLALTARDRWAAQGIPPAVCLYRARRRPIFVPRASAAMAEVCEHRRDSTVLVGRIGESELHEDSRDVPLERLRGHEQVLRDPAV